MNGGRVHAFGDDALGGHDAVALADLLATGEVSRAALIAAAIARADRIDPDLAAIAYRAFDAPRGESGGALSGVPTFLKDNTDLRGMPTNHGTDAFTARRAKRDDPYARQYLSTGMTVLGKSRLPEFGFNASTEFMAAPPTRNPWNTAYSIGASSGGSAALVATGVVPIAHANDGGGSIRIPAAAAGLVGLKLSRHRHIDGEHARHLPINMVAEGAVTRTVRDTAAFTAAIEDYWHNPKLPPIGLVRGPADRRLRVGLVLKSVHEAVVDDETRAAVERTASVLEKAGHVVEPIEVPVSAQFADDFVEYWGLLATLVAATGRFVFDRHFDSAKLDGLSTGLRDHNLHTLHRLPAALRRLRAVGPQYAKMFARHEVVLSPVLAHVPPLLGHLSPTVPYDELIDRLRRYVAFTPLNNIAGTPAISVPAGLADSGVPIGVQLSGAYGDERTLLETAFLLEAEQPFPRITDPAPQPPQ
jgi:amidase